MGPCGEGRQDRVLRRAAPPLSYRPTIIDSMDRCASCFVGLPATAQQTRGRFAGTAIGGADGAIGAIDLVSHEGCALHGSGIAPPFGHQSGLARDGHSPAQYLAALAREKHFTRAAKACNVTQPTLSGRIRQPGRAGRADRRTRAALPRPHEGRRARAEVGACNPRRLGIAAAGNLQAAQHQRDADRPPVAGCHTVGAADGSPDRQGHPRPPHGHRADGAVAEFRGDPARPGGFLDRRRLDLLGQRADRGHALGGHLHGALLPARARRQRGRRP